MKGIIPTGGRGTRMRPLTFSANKHLIPVGNKPLIFYPVESVVGAGIKEIAITYNPGQLEPVKNLLGDGSKWSAKFAYILQPEPKGLANIVHVCEDFVGGESFVFHLGDNIFTGGIAKLVNHFLTNHSNGLLATIHHSQNTRLGVPYYDKKGKLIKLVEKPKHPPNDLAISGVYLADSNFFKCFKGKDKLKPSARGEFEIPDAFQWLIDHGYRVETVALEGSWLDPGKVDDWLETNQVLLDLNTKLLIESGVDRISRIEGRVKISKGCTIVNSLIRGPVNIADNVLIKDSFIGPYTSIDSNSSIVNCHIQNSVVMSLVKLENVLRPIDNSIIGADSQIIGGKTNSHSMELTLSELSKIKL